MNQNSLYERLGGYDGIATFVDDLLPRLEGDTQLGRFWKNRGDDGIAREKQLLIDYLCSSVGGPMYYTGRDMKTSHKGMKISESDWSISLDHAGATMEALQIPQQEYTNLISTFRLFIQPMISKFAVSNERNSQ